MKSINTTVFLVFYTLVNFSFAQFPVPKFVDITQQYEKHLKAEEKSSRRFISTALELNFTLIYRTEMPMQKIVEVLSHLNQLMVIIDQRNAADDFGKAANHCKLILYFKEFSDPSTPDDMGPINSKLEGVNRSNIFHPRCITGVVKYWNLTDSQTQISCMTGGDFARLQQETPQPQSMSLKFEGSAFRIPIGVGIYKLSKGLLYTNGYCVPRFPPSRSPSILVVNVPLPPLLYFPLSPSLLENYLNTLFDLNYNKGFSQILSLIIYRCTLPQNPNTTSFQDDDIITQNRRLQFISSGLFEWSRKFGRGIALDSEFDLVEILKDNFDMTPFWTYGERGGIIPSYKIIGSKISEEYCTRDLVDVVTETRSIFPVINIQIEREYWNASLNCIQDSNICIQQNGVRFYLDPTGYDFQSNLTLTEWTEMNDRVANLSFHCGPTFAGRTFPRDDKTSTFNHPTSTSSINGSFDFPYGIPEMAGSHCFERHDCDNNTLRRANHIVWVFVLLLEYYGSEDRDRAFDYFATVQPRLENYWYNKYHKFRQAYGNTFQLILSIHPIQFEFTGVDTLTALCSEVSNSMGPYIEALVNWAGLRNIPLMLGWIDAKPKWDEFSYPQWLYSLKKPKGSINLSGTFLEVGEFPKSMRFDQRSAPLCFNPGGLLSKRSIFATTLAGVTLDLRPQRLRPAEMELKLLFAFHRFKKVGVFLSGDATEDLETLIRILTDDFFHRLEVNRTLTLYLHIPPNSDQVNVLVNTLQRQLDSRMTVFISESEVEYYQFLDGRTKPWIPQTRSLIQNLAGRRGLSLGDCYTFASHAQNSSQTLLIPEDITFVTCTWEISREDIQWDTKRRISNFVESLLYMKKLLEKILLPSRVEIHFIFGQNQKLIPEESALRFFHAVKEFGENHNISYFIPGFSVVSKSKNASNGGLSWWRVQESNQSLTLPLNYVEREAEYLRLPTWRPNLPPPENHKMTNYSLIWIFTAALALSLLIFAAFVYVIVRRKFRAVLSKQEVDEFYMGCLDGVGFNPDFQLSKSDIIIEYDHVLGRGKFGIVFRGKVSDFVCAVKIPHDDAPKESFKSLLAEVRVLSRLEPHENVQRFIGSYTKDIRMGQVYVVTELCEIGSLESYLRKCEAEDSGLVQRLVRFSREIAAGMEHISANNLIHGDLASRNILLDRDLTCKIADFGFSRELNETQLYVKTSGEPIPWKWMAIESLEKLEFTTQSDVWSYGVTLWEIFSLGNTPYPGYDFTVEFVENLREGMQMAKPALAKDEVFATFRKCWNLDPKQRPSFTKMKEYFTSLEKSDYSKIQ